MEAHDLGSRIRDARERAGLNQTVLGKRTGLERTAITKIEAGARKVTALELVRIADALGVRMARFFEEPLPSIVSHRSNQGLDTIDSKVDRLLEDLAHEVEFVQRALPDSPVATAGGLPAYERPASVADAEALAKRARTALQLSPSEPALRLPELVGKVGLWAFAEDFGPDTADAGTILLRRGAVALINSHNKVGRRRLALVHELGHYLIQDDYTVDWRVNDSSSADIESKLDRFARAFLLPEAALREVWASQVEAEGTREAAVITASKFQVDMSTLARRLEELNIDADTATVRSTYTVAADIITHGLNVSYDLDERSLPVEYQRAVLSLYREHRISVERTLELLRGTLDDGDLPPRRSRVEGELWNFVS